MQLGGRSTIYSHELKWSDNPGVAEHSGARINMHERTKRWGSKRFVAAFQTGSCAGWGVTVVPSWLYYLCMFYYGHRRACSMMGY